MQAGVHQDEARSRGASLESLVQQMVRGLIDELRQDGKKLLLHTEEVGDRIAGFLTGYLRWSGMVPVTHEANIVIERSMGRQLGPTGRSMVTLAERLADAEATRS